MFGFLINAEVNDDAIAVKKFVELALNKYASLPRIQLIKRISNDFDENHRYIDGSNIRFVFAELKYFQFNFHNPLGDEDFHGLSATGEGKYAGFRLHVANGKDWHCSVKDGIAYRATGGAKRLAKIMHDKYGIIDIGKLNF